MKDNFLKTIAFLAFIILFTACQKNGLAPTITSDSTEATAEITLTSAKINGTVTSEGDSPVIERGICWSTSPNPTVSDSKSTDSSNTFTLKVTELGPGTTYYFRAYATNDDGTGYSNEHQFVTKPLAGTKWDFFMVHDPNQPLGGSWHADVEFFADGKAVYNDQPNRPEDADKEGTYTLSGNILSYDDDANDPNNTSYQLTGVINENTMVGTYTFKGHDDKNWSATKY